MDDKDRIRLAEAMGWAHVESSRPDIVHGKFWAKSPDKIQIEPPDPETDANDDYAVLEWMRKEHFITFFGEHLRRIFLLRRDPTISNTDDYSFDVWDFVKDYEIGDYARAALKTLEADK